LTLIIFSNKQVRKKNAENAREYLKTNL
jgi:hypothetical protein